MKIIPIYKVRGHEAPPMQDLLEVIGEMLWEGVVEKPVIVDDDLRAVSNEEVLHSLNKLGVKLVPVSKVGEEIKVPLEDLDFYGDISPKPFRIFNSSVELLRRGWPTPLVLLKSLSEGDVRVWGKLESFNPFSQSIKDRIGWYMFVKALEEGGFRKKEMIYEATSTNTGLALAALAAIHGFKAKLYIPSSIQKVSDIFLKALGAEVVRLPKKLTIECVDEVAEEALRAGAVNLNQFENDYNFEAHLRFTAKELDLQVRVGRLKPASIFGGIGTSGHMAAITFYFRNRYRNTVKVFFAQPAEDEVIPGIRRVESGMKWVHWVEANEVIDITLQEAVEGVKLVGRGDGLLIGLSSGAIVAAYRKVMREGNIMPGDHLLILPDNGFKYGEQLEKFLTSN